MSHNHNTRRRSVRLAAWLMAITLCVTACDDRGFLSGADAANLSIGPAAVPPQTTTTVAPTTVPPAPAAGPVCPVAASTFTDTWGAPRSGGRQHQGVDMLAPAGTPVLAPVSGEVEHRSSSLGGLGFWLDGDDGNTYFGTHLSRYGTDGRVAAGTVIGYVGDTGNATGIPHLHFEVHLGGRGPVNPTPYARSWCG